MKNMSKNLAIGFTLAVLCFPQAVGAGSNSNQRQGRHHGPPPEAFTACEGKSQGDTAEFETPNGETVTGTCEVCRDGDRLVLRPDHHPRPNQTN